MPTTGWYSQDTTVTSDKTDVLACSHEACTLSNKASVTNK